MQNLTLDNWINQDLTMSVDKYRDLVTNALDLKSTPLSEKRLLLDGKTIYFMFFNQSLRTRSSFLTGLQQFGGIGIVLDPHSGIYTPAMPGREIPYSTERVSDVARVLSQYGDAIAIRMYGEPVGWQYGQANETMMEFARWANIPIINMECDRLHPCQALADMMTLKEKFGDVKRRKIVVSWAYSGSWHKPVAVPQSEILAATKMGMDVVLAHPPGFELDEEIVRAAEQFANQAEGTFRITHDMEEAFADADVVYPKSWCSLKHLPKQLGETVDEQSMTALFEANRHWICDENMMRHAKSNALYMHCLPCDRGQEVVDAVVDGSQSIVFDQAKNRMHAQNAIMLGLLK